jgi:hypothetical protein
MYVKPYPLQTLVYPSLMAKFVRKQERTAKQEARNWFNTLPEDSQQQIVDLFQRHDLCAEDILQGLHETIMACRPA